MTLKRRDDLKLILGIDPGLDGGLVTLSQNRVIHHRFVMPVIETTKRVSGKDKTNRLIDLESLDKIMSKIDKITTHAFLEQVGARPDQSAQSVFKFGRVYGILESMLVCHKIPYSYVSPQKWTKEMHDGIEPMEPKDRSKIVVAKLYPHDKLLATRRSSVIHSGLMDALLIAEWGRRQLLQGADLSG